MYIYRENGIFARKVYNLVFGIVMGTSKERIGMHSPRAQSGIFDGGREKNAKSVESVQKVQNWDPKKYDLNGYASKSATTVVCLIGSSV